VIDDHAHWFGLEPTPLQLAEFSLDVDATAGGRRRRADLAHGRVALELLVAALARHLGCAPDEAVGTRDARAAADWRGYVRGLMAAAGITGFVVDPVGPAATTAELAPFADLTGVPAWSLARVDPLLDALVERRAPVAEILAEVDRFVAESVERGAVGFKSVLAYRTGLAVDPDVGPSAAAASLDPATPTRRRGKAVRDLVFRRMLGHCADLALPLQVHTGFGDSELRLAESHPLLLDDVLRTPEGERAPVVLIHGSYPWHEAAAYLAAVRPNVWVEVSLFPMFSPLTAAERIRRILDVVPAGRLLSGTDGHGIPESHWFGALVLRESLDRLRAELTTAGARRGWVDRFERLVLEDNARALYRLEEA
jgi:predicted TIM-barrel fold metal-dependent hydrolase